MGGGRSATWGASREAARPRREAALSSPAHSGGAIAEPRYKAGLWRRRGVTVFECARSGAKRNGSAPARLSGGVAVNSARTLRVRTTSEDERSERSGTRLRAQRAPARRRAAVLAHTHRIPRQRLGVACLTAARVCALGLLSTSGSSQTPTTAFVQPWAFCDVATR